MVLVASAGFVAGAFSANPYLDEGHRTEIDPRFQ